MMKTLIAAVALTIATPAAAQQQHAQHQALNHAQHHGTDHAQHQGTNHARHQGMDHGAKDKGCCDHEPGKPMKCCEAAMKAGKKMECCDKANAAKGQHQGMKH